MRTDSLQSTARLRAHLQRLQTKGPEEYPDGAVCGTCGQGWREFQHQRKDLEQLTARQAVSALGANTRYLNALREI
jgi:hypothetical protein